MVPLTGHFAVRDLDHDPAAGLIGELQSDRLHPSPVPQHPPVWWSAHPASSAPSPPGMSHRETPRRLSGAEPYLSMGLRFKWLTPASARSTTTPGSAIRY